jgi:hypothetical protein
VEQAVAAMVRSNSPPGDAASRKLSQDLMKQFDSDGDGKIAKEEWKVLEETTGWKGGGGHRKADFDFDEEITPAELTLWIVLQDPVNRGGDPKGPKGPPAGSPNGPAPWRLPWPDAKDPSRSGTQASGEKPRSYRFRTRYDRLPKDCPVWFVEKDANYDGQVMMAEFASKWSDAAAAEFQKHDLNGDGIVTVEECLKEAGLAGNVRATR